MWTKSIKDQATQDGCDWEKAKFGGKAFDGKYRAIHAAFLYIELLNEYYDTL